MKTAFPQSKSLEIFDRKLQKEVTAQGLMYWYYIKRIAKIN